MKYDITKPVRPKMPKLGRGLESVNLLLSQVSKSMHEPLAPTVFPSLGAHVNGCEFMYPSGVWMEPCGLIAHICAEFSGNKGQLGLLAEANCRDFRSHDEESDKKLKDWDKAYKWSNQKDRPPRPDVAFYFPPADCTPAGFNKNVEVLAEQGGKCMYMNLPEVVMANDICGGHKKVSKMLRCCFDRELYGQLRATECGVTSNARLRACFTFASTPVDAREFYKSELFNGTLARITFSYVPQHARDGRIPRVGQFSDEFYARLDGYLQRLTSAKGRFIVKPLNKLIDKMAEDMAELADCMDESWLYACSKRSLVSAWRVGCILYLLNNQTFTRSMAEFVEWLVYEDLWSKRMIFSDMVNGKDIDLTAETQRHGPVNMLESLENPFNKAQLKALRVQMGKSEEGTDGQLRQWVFRKLVTYSAETELYYKTEACLKKFKDCK